MRLLWCVALFLWFPFQLQAQIRQPVLSVPQYAQLPDCYRMLSADSAVFYYDASYALTPLACASIRRHTRLTESGDFVGEVRDYWMDSGMLLLRVRYTDNRAHGLLEQFHLNGQPKLRGYLNNSQPEGEWRYWYPSGRPQQTVRVLPADGFRIVEYWDSTGVQRVVNGIGTWQGSLATGYANLPSGRETANSPTLYFRGPLVNGLPHGQWQSVQASTGKVFTQETFVHGRFHAGQLLEKPLQGSGFMRWSKVQLELEGPNRPAERFTLGLTCAARDTLRRQREVFQQLRFAAPPTPLPDYQNQLRRTLQTFAHQPWFQQLPDRVVIGCELDSLGRVAAVYGDNVPLRTVVRDAVQQLPSWQPAAYAGHPTPGGFVVVVSRRSGDVAVQIQLTASTASSLDENSWLSTLERIRRLR